ncbi:DUF1697 domain-containing protein [Cellulomonas aerilata]|uniref:DUF1697 domain-containing protein n=1 Tax=Cellulomonas aerilata TaxID=515326 RepID=A0A512DG92_9CELL|nr:DUF1697 domain-containing protein [Cellulomonas aerilata]GEO35491.1 hypothetical protein CAE01nite_32160 [Cellulomonas aerilata]
MRTHLALLRGINVGGRNRLAMADLREVVTSLGHRDVATYIQSGNVVLTSTGTDAAALADDLERAIAERTDVHPGVVVVPRDALAAVVAGNPYPGEGDPSRLHVVFHRAPLTPEAVEAVADAVRRAQARGSRDEATATGSVVYLHTPDGLGRSELATLLARVPADVTGGVTTTRNWATVTRLLGLLDEG